MPTKTDNSFFDEKVKLRADNLPDADPVNVLDMFHGAGSIWDEVRKQTGRTINVLGIGKKAGMPLIYLQGDNRKFKVDYSHFHIVDCDAYGSPVINLQDILKRARTPLTVFLTFIQTGMGRLPKNLLFALGYTPAMLDKCQTIFNRHGQRNKKPLKVTPLQGFPTPAKSHPVKVSRGCFWVHRGSLKISDLRRFLFCARKVTTGQRFRRLYAARPHYVSRREGLKI